ncbi:hypothetical protein XaC1_509 [Xanthomonas phage XaC1]|nr:hypothetical protein XaC1_509 [Xanthomonas phage XaC1]
MVLNKTGASQEEIESLEPFRELRIKLIEGESILFISEVQKDLVQYFGKYYQYFMLYFKKGRLEYKTYSELTEEDFTRQMIEIV